MDRAPGIVLVSIGSILIVVAVAFIFYGVFGPEKVLPAEFFAAFKELRS
jgi:hypothetical protein